MATILQTSVRQQRGGINRITTSVTPEMLTGTTGQLMLNTFKNAADGAVKLLNQLQDNEDLDKISLVTKSKDIFNKLLTGTLVLQ